MLNPNQKALAKTVSWRVLASVDTLAIAYLVTGSVELAGSIMGIEVITKMVLYYLHERLWNGERKIK